jgi:hypothetical protein
MSRNLSLPRPHIAVFRALSPTDSFNGTIKVSLCKALPLKWHCHVFLLQNEARFCSRKEHLVRQTFCNGGFGLTR